MTTSSAATRARAALPWTASGGGYCLPSTSAPRKYLFSPNLTADSRVLMYRRIAERVRRIAPFLTYDPDPYLAISDGRLVWVQDAYTTSTRYPYSTPSAGGINYIRNSVKVTIDAYDGTVVFHLVDPEGSGGRNPGEGFSRSCSGRWPTCRTTCAIASALSAGHLLRCRQRCLPPFT